MLKQGLWMSKLLLKSLFVYSPDTDNYFFTEFSEKLNIIHGRNTSGKSTLIQSVLYAMGINDSKENLNDINKDNAIFRLDCKVLKNGAETNLNFVRSDNSLAVKQDNSPPMTFEGINGNNSFEYDRYKNLFNGLFNFNLKVQKKSEFIKSPLEAAFLPYYISQSVGWVYIRDSIGDYRFYKDFKFDYLDYYMGLSSNKDRLKKYDLINEKKDAEFEITQLDNYKEDKVELKISEAAEERLTSASIDYLKVLTELNEGLSMDELLHSDLCNRLSMLKGRRKILSRIISNIKIQNPLVDQCPTCDQSLPVDLKEHYIYNQNINDANSEKKLTAEKIKKISSKINSIEREIVVKRSKIKEKDSELRSIREDDVNFNSWLIHKVNLKMIDSISSQQQNNENKLTDIKGKIEDLIDDNDIEALRENKEKEFFTIFKSKAKKLNVSIPKDGKYRELYSISSFPFQGVELHKIIMAYHFSFYEMARKNKDTHEFPFLLDAIFKEDIDTLSREEIFKFISSEVTNNQVIFTVAEYKKLELNNNPEPLFNIDEVNAKYFESSANKICIGNANTKRAFLSKVNFKDKKYLNETIAILETV